MLLPVKYTVNQFEPGDGTGVNLFSGISIPEASKYVPYVGTRIIIPEPLAIERNLEYNTLVVTKVEDRRFGIGSEAEIKIYTAPICMAYATIADLNKQYYIHKNGTLLKTTDLASDRRLNVGDEIFLPGSQRKVVDCEIQFRDANGILYQRHYVTSPI